MTAAQTLPRNQRVVSGLADPAKSNSVLGSERVTSVSKTQEVTPSQAPILAKRNDRASDLLKDTLLSSTLSRSKAKLPQFRSWVFSVTGRPIPEEAVGCPKQHCLSVKYADATRLTGGWSPTPGFALMESLWNSAPISSQLQTTNNTFGPPPSGVHSQSVQDWQMPVALSVPSPLTSVLRAFPYSNGKKSS